MADSSYREIYKHEQIKTEYGLPVRYIVYEEDNAFVSRHWHDDMEIVYLLAGSMVVEAGDCRRILQADDYIIINSRDIHSTRCIGHARILLLQFPINFLRANIPDYDTIRFEGYEQPFLSPEQNEMRKLLLYAADLYTKKDQEGFRLAFLGNLYTILYTLVRDFKRILSPQVRLKTEKNLSRLSTITSYVDTHYTQPISVGQAAALIHVGEEYFCRYFKKYMGLTFLEYVMQVRIRHVDHDLLHTDLPVAEILERNGVSNYKAFLLKFRQLYHMSPRQRREAASSQPL